MTSVPQTRALSRPAISVEALAYVLVALIALGLRLPGLDLAPLGDGEAGQAMAAWRLVSPDAPGEGRVDSPLVMGGAALAIAVFGPSGAAARLIPALAGVGLALAPLAFREKLGRLPALLAAGWLAISPVSVAASRHVDGALLSMLALATALAALWRYADSGSRAALGVAGMLVGLALLADHGALAALLSILLGLGVALATDDETRTVRSALGAWARDLPWVVPALAALATIFVGGTLLFTYPSGLGALGDNLARGLRGFVARPPDAPYLGIVLAVYEPLTLFGLIGLVRAWRARRAWVRFLAGWGAAALAVSLVYPGALPFHALWAVVPLAALAGLALADLLAPDEDAPAWARWLHAGGVVALLAMAAQALVRHVAAPHLISLEALGTKVSLDLVMAGASLVLAAMLWGLVAAAWGQRHAWRGLALGLLLVGVMLSAGQSVSLAFIRPDDPYELLNVAPAQPGLDRLVATAQDMSELSTGNPLEATITVDAPPDGALAWALRNFRNVNYVEYIGAATRSEMVISPAEEPDLALGSDYIGQDFVIGLAWRPAGLSAQEVLAWLVRRGETLASEERVVLWVRDDIFRLMPQSETP
jgi:4-amino-4-deoxy-L-arabinose transferase-like glycosyltransferase